MAKVYRTKDGFDAIPSKGHPERKAWDEQNLRNVRDYFGEHRTYRSFNVPVVDVEPSHDLMPDHPRTGLYTRMYREGDAPAPVVLYRQPGPKAWGMLDGNRRLVAAKAAGRTHIPAIEVIEPKKLKKADPDEAGPDFDRRLRTAWKEVAPVSMMKSPAFRHKTAGTIVLSPVFHNVDHLPAGSDEVEWEDGFVDGHGKFYNRDEAARAVGRVPEHDTQPGYLESYEYATGRQEGLYKAERFIKSPAFRHRTSGQVVESPGIHDLGVLPRNQRGTGEWEDGFVGRDGKFYNREQAARAVSPTPPEAGGPPSLESYDYYQGHREGLYKSEGPKAPRWVKHPEMPVRLRRIFDAVRANLTDDLLAKDVTGRDWRDPKVRGSTHPVAGHCYVAAHALYHLFGGKKMGWERVTLSSPDGPHWFVRHRKTGTIVDPTAEQYDEKPPYDQGIAKPGPVGPPDYDVEKPTKRVQTLMDRVNASLKKSEELAGMPHLEHAVKLPDLRKSIAALGTGRILAHNPRTNESLHDYSHVLSEQNRFDGYKLRLHHIPRTNSLIARVYAPNGKAVGSLSTFTNVENGTPVLGIDTANVNPIHRNKGLGVALYEASYAHGRNHLGISKVVGDAHSPSASRVHQSLARKHGLVYAPEYISAFDDSDPEAMAGPYEYMLKSEDSGESQDGECPRCGGSHVKLALIGEPVFVCQDCDKKWPVEASPGLENSDIGTVRPGIGVITKDMVKSEDWSADDWEEYGQVLAKVVQVAPTQLGLLPGFGGEIIQQEALAAENERLRREQEEKKRQAAEGQLPRNEWGATWMERAEKKQLVQEEIDDFLRRATRPETHPLVTQGPPMWDEAATEERPALHSVSIPAFLDSYWESLNPAGRAAMMASKHDEVQNWLHNNHAKLNDDEFRQVIPTLTSTHFWHNELGSKPAMESRRAAMMLDWAKSVPRPPDEPGERDSASMEKWQEAWDAYNGAWSTIDDLTKYVPLSNEVATRIMNEMPDDRTTKLVTIRNLVDRGALLPQQQRHLMERIDGLGQATPGSYAANVIDYQRKNLIAKIAERGTTPDLQVDATRWLAHAMYPDAIGEALKKAKTIYPETIHFLTQKGGPLHSATAARVVAKALTNRAFPKDALPALAQHKSHDIRLAVASHPNADEDLVRGLTDDKRSAVRKAAIEALKWHDPSSVHPEHVDVRFGTGKLRQIRDLIESRGVEAISPKELPPGDWSKGRDKGGNISSKKLQEHIDSLPATKYGVSEGIWKGPQRHSRERSYVFQLNLSTEQAKKLKEAGVWDTFRRMHAASLYSGHPAGHAGLGWVRWTGDENGIHIDEVQSDLGQSFIKHAAALARHQGLDENEARASKDYPEEHYEKIKDIVFGGKHPSEVLQEAFHQWLRNGKEQDQTGYNPRTGTTFRYGGRPKMVGTPIHIWQPESKATISLHGGEDKALPGHFQVGYRDVPVKRFGMKPAKYGELETQTAKQHKGKATWADILRKSEYIWDALPDL